MIKCSKSVDIDPELPAIGVENMCTINVDVDAFSIYASNEVLSSWSQYSAQPITEPEPQKDQTLLLAVELGLIIMFVGIFVISLYRKMRSGI